MESQALEKQEKDQRTKDSLKAKKAELEAKEEMKKAEKEANAETIKKTKIQRETVDDELQCDFEVTFDVDDDDDDEGEPIANDQGTSEPNKRRYRRKGDAEEGEIDDHEGSRSRSPSRSRSKSRSYSRSRSRSRSETTLSDSEDEANIEMLREKRKERLRDIKEQKRVTKSASEVDEGEVDSEGEDFKIIEDTEQSEVKVDNEELMEPINPNEPKEHTEPLEPKEPLESKEPLEPKKPFEPKEPLEPKEQDESDTKHEDMRLEKQEINKGTELIPEEVSSEQVEPIEEIEEKLESVEPEEIIKDNDIDKEEEPMEVQDSESVLESDSQDPQSSSAMTSSQPSPLINETDSQDSIKVSKKRRKAWTRQVPNPQESEELVQEEEPDYVFKTKRQLLHEREHAPEEPVEVEDEEELERQKEAEKIKEKRQKQMEMRLKRMQAFQERSEIKEDEQEGDFYKSYHEAEEERLRIEQEQEAAQAAQEAVQAAQESELEQPEKPQYIEITKDEPTKDPEVSEKEGVAYWTKMIDDDDDVEVPKPGSPAKIKKGSRDLPSKAQVDAHQAEQETWADRWYQNKKVQKVVQDSKIYSKVKANIKTKFVKPIEAIEESLRPGTSAKDLKAEAIRRKLNKNPQNNALPVIGSLDEYSKIKTSEPLETKSDSSDDDSSDEGDGLWSAIMGKD